MIHIARSMLCVLIADGVPDGVLESVAATQDLSIEATHLRMVEGRLAGQQDEQHDAARPHVHLRAILAAWRALHLQACHMAA